MFGHCGIPLSIKGGPGHYSEEKRETRRNNREDIAREHKERS
jgi:hypothetical protein